MKNKAEIESELIALLESDASLEAITDFLSNNKIQKGEFTPIAKRHCKKLRAVVEALRLKAQDSKSKAQGIDSFIKIRNELQGLRTKPPREATALIESAYPNLFAHCYPRHFTVPGGFYTPKRFGLCAFWSMFDASAWKKDVFQDRLNIQRLNIQNQSAAKIISALVEKTVPTYFVSRAIMEALTKTDLPKDFSLQEMPWPLDAMLFMLPEGALRSPDGDISFIAISKIVAGVYPNTWMDWGRISELIESHVIEHEGEETVSVLAMAENGRVFQWEHPLNTVSIHDASLTRIIGGDIGELEPVVELSDIEKGFAANDLPKAVFQFILAMLACPEMIEAGAIMRHSSTKKRKAMRELWSPNFFGKAYRKYNTVVGDGDETRQNRAHWRRGHFRHQRYGAGLKAIRVIWIQPVLVGKEHLAA